MSQAQEQTHSQAQASPAGQSARTDGRAPYEDAFQRRARADAATRGSSWSKPMPARPVVAVAGATGAVGREMLKCLDKLHFPASEVRALASARSAGTRLPFGDGELIVREMAPESFAGVDIALFSAGAGVSRQMRQAVTEAGAVMIDNSSAFRMEDDVPLVVPEVNPYDVAWHNGVIANPNCTTIQMVVALQPLRALGHIDRIVVSSYQSASGAGAKGMNELRTQTREVLDGEPPTVKAFQHQIAFNCIPHIDVFHDDGYTKEEWKMVVETKKIFGDDTVRVAPTCVRVPVMRCHSESINLEFDRAVSVQDVRDAIVRGEHVCLEDDPANNVYPMPAMHAGSFDTFVGRVRRDPTVDGDCGVALWVVADQLLRGAALNAVMIAQLLLPDAARTGEGEDASKE
ncbi:MAG: aspartate-semialdehyde dehydrogenase [Coriobacteriales bacterium]|jgi:aspartate-semialdehyde dehydrogenase